MADYLTSYAPFLAAGPARLGEVATPDNVPVPAPEVLRQVLDGQGDFLDPYDPEVASAATVADALDAAIARAEGALRAAVYGRYVLPLDVVDDFVLGLLADLAWYYLYPPGREIADSDRERAEQAMAHLKAIQSGALALAATAATSATTSAGAPQVSAGAALWRDGTLDDYQGPQ